MVSDLKKKNAEVQKVLELKKKQKINCLVSLAVSLNKRCLFRP